MNKSIRITVAIRFGTRHLVQRISASGVIINDIKYAETNGRIILNIIGAINMQTPKKAKT